LATKQLIETSIFGDKWFRKLSDKKKLIYLYLLINPEMNPAGLYEIDTDVISIKLKVKNPKELLKELSPKVIFDSKNDLIWLPKYFIKNSKGPIIWKAVQYVLDKYAHSFLVDNFVETYKYFKFNRNKIVYPENKIVYQDDAILLNDNDNDHDHDNNNNYNNYFEYIPEIITDEYLNGLSKYIEESYIEIINTLNTSKSSLLIEQIEQLSTNLMIELDIIRYRINKNNSLFEQNVILYNRSYQSFLDIKNNIKNNP